MDKKVKKTYKKTTIKQASNSNDFQKAFKIAQQLSSPTLFSKQDKQEIISSLIKKVCN